MKKIYAWDVRLINIGGLLKQSSPYIVGGQMGGKISQEKIDAIKQSIRQSQIARAEHPSGYNAFSRGERNVLTGESAKLSSKNFDRLMQARGIKPEDAKALKDSFNEYQPYKEVNSNVTVRHVLQPEQARAYSSKNGSSGNFQTTDKYDDSSTAKKKLALTRHNDASLETTTTINPTLANGKQHNVLEGTVAPQDKDGEHFNKYREGGGKQIVTDGGYNSGAVSKGDTRQMNSHPQKENGYKY